MHEEELQHIGLSEKEAKVYLATLTLGKATALEISKKTGLKRPTAYFTVDSLMKKGLMSSVYEGKKQYFMAENPERLVDVFEAKQDEVRRQGEKLKKLIPDLKQLRPKTDDGPVVKYYTGKEGALSMVKNLLNFKDKETVWMIYDRDVVNSVFTRKELDEIKFTRHGNNISVRALYTSNDKVDDDATISRKRLNKEDFHIEADIAVYGDKVRLASFGNDVVGMMFENKQVAETLKHLFTLAWEAADNHVAKDPRR